MKKLMLAVAIVCAAVVSQAAAFSWEGFDITDINGDAFTGAAVLCCSELPSFTSSGEVVGGELVGTDFASDDFVAGTSYHFYFTAEDPSGNTYRSEEVFAKALGVGAQSISFEGNGTWTAAAIPEPTSGLLLLLGVAGLALKRKRA